MTAVRVLAAVAAALLFIAGCGGSDRTSAPSPGFEGRVVDEQGTPLADVDACWIVGEGLGACGISDADGRVTLPGPAHERFRVTAGGYHARQLSVNALDAPIVLSRSPVLFVLLTDGITGEPIEGQVFVAYSSGRQLGPFPVNRAGLRVRRVLAAGEAFLRPQADGYGPIDPVPITLAPGKETKAEIPMPPV